MEKTYFQLIQEFKDYAPKDDTFTSAEEVKLIEEHFGLNGRSLWDLQNLRDMVVMFYGEWRTSLYRDGKKDEAIRKLDAMMSITAVIDHVKYSKGGEI